MVSALRGNFWGRTAPPPQVLSCSPLCLSETPDHRTPQLSCKVDVCRPATPAAGLLSAPQSPGSLTHWEEGGVPASERHFICGYWDLNVISFSDVMNYYSAFDLFFFPNHLKR